MNIISPRLPAPPPTKDIVAKRALDLVSASALLVLTLPLLALIALMIRLVDGGPVLFRQTRIGLHGAPFTLLKFRTMTETSDTLPEAAHPVSVTALGRHLRRWGLDEFPQLLNVLAGQMSMVGPRPHTQDDDARWMKAIDAYAERSKVKPGITGWAQVNGYHGFSSGDEALSLRVQLDVEYAKNWSLLFDLRILILTIFELPMDQRGNRAP
ncbi:MAG: sugar transferase [Magnetospirillum sp.]|nr:sugar transferase [Magnetospirillum sp.]